MKMKRVIAGVAAALMAVSVLGTSVTAEEGVRIPHCPQHPSSYRL